MQRLFRSVVSRFRKALDNGKTASLEGALDRQRRIPVQTVIDVGASNGCWSRRAMRFYPQASYLLIEAQQHPHEPELAQFQKQFANTDYVIAAAGPREGKIYFDATDPLGGQASEQPFPSGKNIEVPVTTIDLEVNRRGLQPPYLLKLDTHGFEVPIFQGAVQTLAQTNLIVVEVYNFKLIEGCLRFHELCAHLEERGFRCLDIFDLMHRPKDHVLWQLDMIFARQDRPEFQCNTYV